MANKKSFNETKIAFLQKTLKKERAFIASLLRHIEALEGKADFQRKIIESLQQKIELLEHKEDGP